MSKPKLEAIIDRGVYALILLSTLAIILESDQELSQVHHSIFKNFEVFSIVIFSIEYSRKNKMTNRALHSPFQFTMCN